VDHNSIHHLEIERELVRWDPNTCKSFFDEANKELIIAKPTGGIIRASLDGTKGKRQFKYAR